MKMNLVVILSLCIGLFITNLQAVEYNGYLQTRKLFLFGPDNGFDFQSLNKTHSFMFQRPFFNTPRVGLAVYTMDFEYSPDFSCRITSATNKTATAVRISTYNSNVKNKLYIMYMATDNEHIGIFVPQRLYTDSLSLPTRTKYSQNFDFNFKGLVSQLANKNTDITTTVYLTGVSTTSEMTTNGFPTNKTSISLRIARTSTRFYTLEVNIGQEYPFTLLDWVECTIVYFIPQVVYNHTYQINSGSVTLKGFGGTLQPVSQYVDLLPLALDNRFEDLRYFYGISRIQCKDGQSVTLLGVEKFYNSPQDKSIRLLLQMQTWKLTYIQLSSFNYIQYKSLKCTQPGANCNSTCSKDLRPYFMIQNQCNYCHYSCLTCNVTNQDNYCDTCHKTRQMNKNNNICDCLTGFYQTRDNYECKSCFPCATCDKANTCLTCLEKDNMVLNAVTSECQCKPGHYADIVNGTIVRDQPCLKCQDGCLYCVAASQCKACTLDTFLFGGICIPICKPEERFNSLTNKCQLYTGNLYDQKGRLDFDWSYIIKQNQMVIDVVFSQTVSMAYYYYQSGKGFTHQDYMKHIRQGQGDSNGGSDSSIYYDDGIYMNGYESSSGNSNSGSAGDYNSGDSSSNAIDQSALRGQYYGLGQAKFFQSLYVNQAGVYNNQAGAYNNQYNIPYGKYDLSSEYPISNPNCVDALSRNLLFRIGGQIIPYTMQAVSNNHFILRTRPMKTYINAIGQIQIRNPALTRSNNTALQKRIVDKQINRFNYYTQRQLNTAYSIKNSNQILVDILWGICKYLLFVGFGWPFLPIMLALQYIMSFNYIHSNIPLNLDYFLASFRDFRNPSLLFKPFRDQFDVQVVSHPNIYKSIDEFEQFDRGIDFMKNSWEFFFIPFLAFVFLFMLHMLNLIFRKCCRRDFTLISKFLVPRAPLLAAAYTLVWALPVSFFFFAQLKDTTFRHPLEPNRAYPTFNTAMAYLAFFLTCAIPILLLAWLYYHFNYGNRITKFSDANAFNRKFLNKIDNSSGQFSRAQLNDAFWGGDHAKTSTYIFGISVFLLAIVFGFFLAFFIKDFAWQLAGLLLFTAIFLAFAVTSNFFVNRIIKVFFIMFIILMLAYLLLHAGIGSNRAIGTYDQWNTGYLGIGILYALLITAILFTTYLLYKFLGQMYLNHSKYGYWIDIDKKNEVQVDNKEVKRVTQYRRDTKMKSTFLKNGTSLIGQGALAGNNVLGIKFNYNTLTSNVKRVSIVDLDNLYSEQRMIMHSNDNNQQNVMNQLVLSKQDQQGKEVMFISKGTNMLFGFPEQNGRMLMARLPIYVDGQNRIYDNNKQFIDYYHNLQKKPANTQSRSRKEVIISQENPGQQMNSYKTITSRKEIFVINGEQYQKTGEEIDGNMRLKNIKSGQIQVFDMSSFKKGSSSLLQYDSNSKLQMQGLVQINKNTVEQKFVEQGRGIIYGGQEYLDLGYDLYSRQFKVLNQKTNQIQKLPKARYIKMIEQSSKKRVHIGSEQYDYEGTDPSGRVYLRNNSTKQQLIVSQQQFQSYRQLNLTRFHAALNRDLASNNNGDKPDKVIYQGQQYESYGLDQQGRHRLYNPALRKHIIISNDQFRNLSGNKILTKGSQDLLLLQSAIGTMKRSESQKQSQRKRQGQRQPQIKLESQTSRYYVFEEQNGHKMYVPKSKINPDLPIEIDQYGNLSQNNQIVFNKTDARFDAHPQRKTQNIVSSSRNIVQNNVNVNTNNANFNSNSANVNITKNSQQNLQVVQNNIQGLTEQELDADDAINPDNYYRILGIPAQKVNNYKYKKNDVYLTEKNVRGKQVMQKIQKIQAKYPNLLLLVKNQSDEMEEFWVN